MKVTPSITKDQSIRACSECGDTRLQHHIVAHCDNCGTTFIPRGQEHIVENVARHPHLGGGFRIIVEQPVDVISKDGKTRTCKMFKWEL